MPPSNGSRATLRLRRCRLRSVTRWPHPCADAAFDRQRSCLTPALTPRSNDDQAGLPSVCADGFGVALLHEPAVAADRDRHRGAVTRGDALAVVVVKRGDTAREAVIGSGTRAVLLAGRALTLFYRGEPHVGPGASGRFACTLGVSGNAVIVAGHHGGVAARGRRGGVVIVGRALGKRSYQEG